MRASVPWIGLAAIAAMFLLPFLDARGLFDGPHTIRRRPAGRCAPTAPTPGPPATSAPAGWRRPYASRSYPYDPCRRPHPSASGWNSPGSSGRPCPGGGDGRDRPPGGLAGPARPWRAGR